MLLQHPQQAPPLQQRQTLEPDHALQLAQVGRVAQRQQFEHAEEVFSDREAAEHQLA